MVNCCFGLVWDSTWRITPGRTEDTWLITMVLGFLSPKDRVVPDPFQMSANG